MNKVLCPNCKRELDWEEIEIIKNMPREHLIKYTLELRQSLKDKTLLEEVRNR